MPEVNSQDLTHETLLQGVGRMQVGAFRQPALGGIPMLSKIGQGEAGACYRAIHPTMDCEVAVKVMPYSAEERSERFGILLAHAHAAMKVESPRLVKVLDVATEADCFFQVMEYIDGRSAQAQLAILRERLKPGMDETAVLDLCIAAATGLKAAHDANFIHRDIRPSAIMIPKGEGDEMKFSEAKLADLGLAFNDAAARLLEGSPAQTGTPGYMSPEEASGAKDITPASDVFSMGATIYGLLVGQPPFGGPSLNVVLSSTSIQECNDLRTWRPDVSRATARIVEGCLKKSAALRFPNAGALLKALQIARSAYNAPVEAQAAAIREIDALLPNAAKLDPAIQQLLNANSPESMPEASEEIGGDEATVIAGKMQFPAVAGHADDANSLDSELAEAAAAQMQRPAAAVRTVNLDSPGSTEVWEEPAEANADVDVAPKRSFSAPLMAAALLAVAVGVGAWQMGFLTRKPKKTVVVNTLPVLPTDPANPGGAGNPADPAHPVTVAVDPNAPVDPKLVTTDADVKAAEAKLKEEQEKIAAAAKAKEDEAKRVAEAEFKATQEREAAAKKLKDEEEQRVAAERVKEEQAKAAAEARVKEEAEQKRVAEAEQKAKAQAEQELALKKKANEEAALAAAKLKADQEAEARRVAEAKTHPATQTDPATPSKPATPTTVAAAVTPKETVPAQAVEAELPKELTLDLGNGVSMDFVLVTGGTFMMGTDRAALREICRKAGAEEKDYADETPAHRTELPSYYIAKTPVTVGQFRTFVSATQFRTAAERRGEGYMLTDHTWQLTPAASWMKPGFPQTDDHPVVNVNWRDCNAFAEWASKQSGRRLRLPTESEWEYAARGPQNNIYPWGNTWDGRRANHSDMQFRPFGPRGWMYSSSDDGYAFTSPIGTYKNQSWCGALDLAGNVFQWCADAYAEYPQSPTTPEIVGDPADTPSNAKRPVRGGSYLFRPIDCRSSARRSLSPNAWSYELGMRLAFSAK